MLRRRQVQPDDVAHLLDKQRIGRELEILSATGWGLKAFHVR
jgi:hypothetical protein